jgi:hypothetical protein
LLTLRDRSEGNEKGARESANQTGTKLGRDGKELFLEAFNEGGHCVVEHIKVGFVRELEKIYRFVLSTTPSIAP